MDQNYPIYTANVECQDCYKCVRECPVKAIKVNEGHASIIPELCTACGHCVVTCPVNAKKIRDDIYRLELLLLENKKVYASIAPSWVTNFPNISKAQLIKALKQIGFAGVSETALGAQQVTAGLIDLLDNATPGLYISSACPSVVDFIAKHATTYKNNIVKLLSPLMAHTLLLRKHFGKDIEVVFFGPCVAKKTEADRYSDKLTLSLTFQDLNTLFKKQNICFDEFKDMEENFVPYEAEEGSLYPIVGGMINTMGIDERNFDVETLSISGLPHLIYYLEGLDVNKIDRKIFIEALACEGGCINGPAKTIKSAGLNDRIKIKDRYRNLYNIKKRKAVVNINEMMKLPKVKLIQAQPEERIKKALAKIGKYKPEDELNCGGCGYDTCRLFAEALLNGKAETEMCVSLMRKKALNKANAILKRMPSGVVIVDSQLQIIECNKRFAEMFGDDTLALYEVLPSLKGAFIDRIVPFADLFKLALRTGEDIFKENLRAGDKLLHLTLFTIEQKQIVGGIIQDATKLELKREEIAKKANEILRKNLNTVQGVAKLLGEHMADTEILLRSISKGFSLPVTNTQVVKVKTDK